MSDTQLTSQDLARYLTSRNARFRSAGLSRDALYQRAKEQALNEVYNLGIEADPESDLITLFELLGVVETKATKEPKQEQPTGGEEKKEEPATETGQEITISASIPEAVAAIYQSVITDTLEQFVEEPPEPLDEDYLNQLILQNNRELPGTVTQKRLLASTLLSTFFIDRGMVLPEGYPIENLVHIAAAIGQEEQAQNVDTEQVFKIVKKGKLEEEPEEKKEAEEPAKKKKKGAKKEPEAAKPHISRTELREALEVLGLAAEIIEDLDDLSREELDTYVRDSYLSALQQLKVAKLPARETPISELVRAYEVALGVNPDRMGQLKEEVKLYLNQKITARSQIRIIEEVRRILQERRKDLPQGKERYAFVKVLTEQLQLPYLESKYDADDNYVDLVGMYLVTKYPEVYGPLGDHRALLKKRLLDSRILTNTLPESEYDRLTNFILGVNAEAGQLADSGFINPSAGFANLTPATTKKRKQASSGKTNGRSAGSSSASTRPKTTLKVTGAADVSMSSRSLPKSKR